MKTWCSGARRWTPKQASAVRANLDRARRLDEPRLRRVVDLRRHRLAHAAVIVVQPLPLGLGEQAGLDARKIDRRKRERLELEIASVGAFDFGFAHGDQVL